MAEVMTVSQFAKRAGVVPHVIRYYTRIGLLKPRRQSGSDYKLFTAADVKRLHFIQRAKALGFTLDEIAEIFHASSHGKSPCPRVREIIRRRVDENRRALSELTALQRRMEKAVAQWAEMPNGIPDGDTVCHLIESLEDVETRDR